MGQYAGEAYVRSLVAGQRTWVQQELRHDESLHYRVVPDWVRQLPWLRLPETARYHYSDVIMSAIASKITGTWVVCSGVCSGADQRKHQSSKGPVTRKMFPFDCVIMYPRYLESCALTSVCLAVLLNRRWNKACMSDYIPHKWMDVIAYPCTNLSS